jgi:hypothetical protein
MTVNVQGHAYLVPFVESGTDVFLKTIISSRSVDRGDFVLISDPRSDWKQRPVPP